MSTCRPTAYVCSSFPELCSLLGDFTSPATPCYRPSAIGQLFHGSRLFLTRIRDALIVAESGNAAGRGRQSYPVPQVGITDGKTMENGVGGWPPQAEHYRALAYIPETSEPLERSLSKLVGSARAEHALQRRHGVGASCLGRNRVAARTSGTLSGCGQL